MSIRDAVRRERWEANRDAYGNSTLRLPFLLTLGPPWRYDPLQSPLVRFSWDDAKRLSEPPRR